MVAAIIRQPTFGLRRSQLGILHGNSLDVLHQPWLVSNEILVEPNASPFRARFNTAETPDTELAMEGAEVRLPIKKLRSYLLHEDIRIVNGESTAFGHP